MKKITIFSCLGVKRCVIFLHTNIIIILLLSVANLPPVDLLVVNWIDKSYLCHAADVHVISCDNIHYDIMDGMPLATDACNQYIIKAFAKKVLYSWLQHASGTFLSNWSWR